MAASLRHLPLLREGGVRPPSPPPSQTGSGASYKAVIMLFLKGGMDSFQMPLGHGATGGQCMFGAGTEVHRHLRCLGRAV